MLEMEYFFHETCKEMASFRIKYLKDYQNAVHDIRNAISQIPDNLPYCSPAGVSNYSDLFFALADAEYCNQEYDSAYKYWVRAEELYYGYKVNSDYVIVHYDSLIQNHPNSPELYLARAIAFIVWAKTANGLKSCYESALIDLSKAESRV